MPLDLVVELIAKLLVLVVHENMLGVVMLHLENSEVEDVVERSVGGLVIR